MWRTLCKIALAAGALAWAWRWLTRPRSVIYYDPPEIGCGLGYPLPRYEDKRS